MNLPSARYRIQAVSDLTGVSTATLRAWERRYGFPSPQRTDSAYRLYSDHDVELVKKMQSLVDSGIAPNEAARELLAETKQAVTPPPLDADPYVELVDRIYTAAAAMDLPTLQQELRRALLLDSGLTVFERVLHPALTRIGEGWHQGTLSVAAEHLASHLISGTTLDLLRLTKVAPNAKTVLLACFAEELHTIPLLGAALAFATNGYRPIVLGARTPPTAVARGIESLTPDVVGLSATVMPHPPSHARELVDGYADACGKVPWFVGGASAEALRTFVEARGGVIVTGGSEAISAAVDNLVARRGRVEAVRGEGVLARTKTVRR